ncbi:MAG TPA: hypothetical protein VHO70_07700 [Chitinispirillaceae bacterium]|nr:hypothetical protein [Chitinispirillaceae bacterium]
MTLIVFAALDSSTGNLVLVVRNNAESEVNYSIDLSRFESIGTLTQVYRFQLPGSLKQESAISVNNKQVSFTAPKLSITTCIIPLISTSLKSRVTDKNVNELKHFISLHDYRLWLSPDQRGTCTISMYDCRGVRVFNSRAIAGDPLITNYDGKRMLANGIYLVKQTPLNGAANIYHNK